jgi:outer membrane immunogenic protein
MHCIRSIILSLGFAAPLPVLAQAQPYDWTGFYAGAHFGYGFGQPVNPAIGFFDPDAQGIGTYLEAGGFNIASYPNKGVLGGVQAGYNYQLSSWLVGVEADWSATDINGAHSGTAGAFDSTTFTTTRMSLDWLATLRTRVGVTSDNWLFYGTGGLALGRITSGFDTSFKGNNVPVGFSFNGANSATNVGWTAGAGTEYALGRFSVKLEYLYYDVGATRVTSQTSDTVIVPGVVLTLDQRTAGHIIRAGLNYHF